MGQVVELVQWGFAEAGDESGVKLAQKLVDQFRRKFDSQPDDGG